MAEITPADPNTAARTRARRTLIGSAILALTAVVVLPLVIDSKPKPWGDDVKLRIPAKDSAFDTPLAAPSVPSASPTSASPPTPPAAAAAPTPAASAAPASPSAAPSASVSPASTVSPGVAPAATEKPSPTPTPAKTQPTPIPTPAKPAAAAPPKGKMVLQAGAFTTDERIKAVEAELRKAGYTPYREEVPAKSGVVTRIRFNVANEEAAQKAIAKLAAGGITPKIVTP